MLRVMIVLGLLVLVPAALVFWRLRDRSAADASSAGKAPVTRSKDFVDSTSSAPQAVSPDANRRVAGE